MFHYFTLRNSIISKSRIICQKFSCKITDNGRKLKYAKLFIYYADGARREGLLYSIITATYYYY